MAWDIISVSMSSIVPVNLMYEYEFGDEAEAGTRTRLRGEIRYAEILVLYLLSTIVLKGLCFSD